MRGPRALLVLVQLAMGLWLAPSIDDAVGQNQLRGMQLSPAPWLAERIELAERLRAIGLPALREEGQALHTHQHLDVVIEGKTVLVPASIGIDWLNRFISPVHTHDETGIIHIESPTVGTFTLGQFFDIWGVRLDATCIGAYCAGRDKLLRVYTNGTPVGGDPRALALTPHLVIAVMYGTRDQVARPPRAWYDFPRGL